MKMNKYLHAVGFAVGLVAVVLVSVADGFLMTESGVVSVPFAPRVYALLWLVTYILIAFLTGEFVVRKEIRKGVLLPVGVLLCTVGLFWAFYRAQNVVFCIVFCALIVVLLCITLKIMIKHAFYACFITLGTIGWYALILGRLLFS